MTNTPIRQRWLALALLAATQFILILDAAIVIVALPSIKTDLNFTTEGLSWVVSIYALTFGGFLLLGGRLADLVGRRLLFIVGLALFTLASIAGALAQSDIWLIVARAVQGFGGAIVSPAALSLALTLFPEGRERNKALGVWSAVSGSGAAAGSILGGLLTEWFGWQAVLWVNAPIGLLVIVLAPRLLPKASSLALHRSFDFAGAILSTAGLALLVYTLVDAEHAGWGSAQTIGLGALAVIFIAAFLLVEMRSSHPLMPLEIFRLKALRAANLLMLIASAAVFPFFFFTTTYMQTVLGFSPIESGLGLIPTALLIALLANSSARLVSRVGFKMPLIVGFLLVAIGLGWASQISAPDGNYWAEIFGPSVLLGLGMVLAFVSTTIAATSGTPPEQSGLASGLLNTSQQVGGALGIAALTAVSAAASAITSPSPQAALVSMTNGFQAAFLVGAIAVLVCALLAAILVSAKHSNEFIAKAADNPQDKEAEEPVMIGV